MGEVKWLTVVSSNGAAEVGLLLEPTYFPPATVYQKALFDPGSRSHPLASTISRRNLNI